MKCPSCGGPAVAIQGERWGDEPEGHATEAHCANYHYWAIPSIPFWETVLKVEASR